MEEINIKGYVTVKQGDDVLVDRGENSLLENMLKGMIKMYSCTDEYFNDSDQWHDSIRLDLGNGGDTATSKDMGSLYDRYDTHQDEVEYYGIETGDWYALVRYTFVFNAETLQDDDITDVNELGLYTRPVNNGWNDPSRPGFDSDEELCARICEADGTLTGFNVDQSKTLTVEWEYEWVIE